MNTFIIRYTAFLLGFICWMETVFDGQLFFLKNIAETKIQLYFSFSLFVTYKIS